jgi:hypothetical protein
MKVDLFGDYVIYADDFIPSIVAALNKQQHCFIRPTINTLKGFTKSLNFVLPKEGIYVIYKFGHPIYVGHSKSSIHNRIARFLAGVRGTERLDEKHPAAYKYKHVYGENFDDLSVKIFRMRDASLPKHISLDMIENELISELRPVFNTEVYSSLWISANNFSLHN